jgi:hypothetical protein
VIALLGAMRPAAASTVRSMTLAELSAGADAVIEGEVGAISTSWNADGSGLETRVTVTVTGVVRGDAPAVITIVQPGGELGAARQVIAGMPRYATGERARFSLRRLAAAGEFRVYGWSQGKVLRQAAPGDGTLQFTTNGMVWPPGEIPVPYLLNSTGSDDLSFGEVTDAVAAAFATWENVPCASLAFSYAGLTDLGVDVDDQNVVLFIESGWIYGEEAAGATSLFVLEDMQTADIAINGENFAWAIEPAGSLATDVLDLQAVLTHEIGHFGGMGHTQRAYDTMYYSWKPWPGQRTLSIDDKLGLCSIYPTDGDECDDAGDCDAAAAERCDTFEHGRLCAGDPAPIGTPCNYDVVECDGFCLFTAANLSSGYCSQFCETNGDCPLTHHCDDASAGGEPVRVCYDGDQPIPDAGVPDAASGSCADDDACPTGQFCDLAAGSCTFDCRIDDDCPGAQVCTERGACAGADTDDGGCGCDGGLGGGAAAGPIGLAWLVAVRRRRRAPPRPLQHRP